MDEVAVNEGVLKQRRHRVDVVFAHLGNVLEHESERLGVGALKESKAQLAVSRN